MGQLEYLEKLVEGYRARLKAGDRSVEVKLRHASAKLEELKLKMQYEAEQAKKKPKFLGLARIRKSCCR